MADDVREYLRMYYEPTDAMVRRWCGRAMGGKQARDQAMREEIDRFVAEVADRWPGWEVAVIRDDSGGAGRAWSPRLETAARPGTWEHGQFMQIVAAWRSRVIAEEDSVLDALSAPELAVARTLCRTRLADAPHPLDVASVILDAADELLGGVPVTVTTLWQPTALDRRGDEAGWAWLRVLPAWEGATAWSIVHQLAHLLCDIHATEGAEDHGPGYLAHLRLVLHELRGRRTVAEVQRLCGGRPADSGREPTSGAQTEFCVSGRWSVVQSPDGHYLATRRPRRRAETAPALGQPTPSIRAAFCMRTDQAAN